MYMLCLKVDYSTLLYESKSSRIGIFEIEKLKVLDLESDVLEWHYYFDLYRDGIH